MHRPLDTEVLIVGAGPTGLVLALWLTRLGVRVRIIDKTAEPVTTSRALAVQARTLELYGQIDLAKEIVERGRRIAAARPGLVPAVEIATVRSPRRTTAGE